MRKKFHNLMSLVVASLVAASGQAANFTFSFHTDFSDPNITGGIPGTLTGRILGLADAGTSAAASVIIDSYPNAVTPADATAWTTIVSNRFTVAGGIITGGSFGALRGNGDTLYLNTYFAAYQAYGNYASLGSQNQQRIWNNKGLSGVTFTPLLASVPEPATWALLVFGFGTVGTTIRRQRKARLYFA